MAREETTCSGSAKTGSEAAATPADFEVYARLAAPARQASAEANSTKPEAVCPKAFTRRAERSAEAALSPPSKEAALTQREARTMATEPESEATAAKEAICPFTS